MRQHIGCLHALADFQYEPGARLCIVQKAARNLSVGLYSPLSHRTGQARSGNYRDDLAGNKQSYRFCQHLNDAASFPQGGGNASGTVQAAVPYRTKSIETITKRKPAGESLKCPPAGFQYPINLLIQQAI